MDSLFLFVGLDFSFVLISRHLHLLVDEQPSHAHARADAHGREQDLGLAASALAEACDDLSCAGAAEGVALFGKHVRACSEGERLFVRKDGR